jgi:hypothetical protein
MYSINYDIAYNIIYIIKIQIVYNFIPSSDPFALNLMEFMKLYANTKQIIIKTISNNILT